MKKIYLLLLFLFPAILLNAQDKTLYVVKLTDKANSQFHISEPAAFLSHRAIERRLRQNIPIDETDLPVSPAYLKQIRQEGAEIVYSSKWLNTVILSIENQSIYAKIAAKPFVKRIYKETRLFENQANKPFFDNEIIYKNSPTNNVYPKNTSAPNVLSYGASFNQVNMIAANQLHNLGYMGQGFTIAVIDAGFKSANTMAAFDSLRANNRILGTQDFVSPGNNVYQNTMSSHGTYVLSTMAGWLPGQLIGTAPHANYWLLRSEDATAEYLMEEYYWVKAAEFADSAGADIINSSLGYTLFDNPAENHTYADMDGNTTVITKGADRAASKGILVVSSAGNSGNNPWKYISAPADGDSVLTVGAVNAAGIYAGFSSIGPTYDGRTKPDVSAQGAGCVLAKIPTGITQGDGTSFSSPIIAGAAACLWQANPTYSAQEIIHAIKQSATLNSNPNNQIGWGIPDFLAASSKLTVIIPQETDPFDRLTAYPNPILNDQLMVALELNNPETIDIRIYNSYGREVFAKTGVKLAQGKNLIALNQLDALNKGIYMLQVSDGYYVQTLKLLK
ncbi:MAG: S8 family serine peptidase [Lentimicrobium sp.]|jgi:subtilisin family serine protease|nr:S8 family serine peptidase [Lentimicrobium sp.]MDD2526817.1 S8 family serine peptidase [Lentimicrobiaceae bacterium]MDD4598115.1 S8 family serine peptidase [Lentimicrobiaceae bacterium]MDY0024430.1 S8 family serine peptidase [Lentimicrobium sp.]